MTMFNPDFYPTPLHVIDQMLHGFDVSGKVILEPSAGKGNIVDACIGSGAMSVIACEQSPELKKILAGKCKVIGDDFMKVTSDQISHIDAIIMNPPFSADEKHINHAFDIAPDGCEIIALCNLNTVKNPYSGFRQQLVSTIKQHGSWVDLGDCFTESERTTDVKIALIRIKKPGTSYQQEFEGFFMEDEQEAQSNGIMPYNLVREVVNRYVGAVKLFDQQMAIGVQMNDLTKAFFSSSLSFTCTSDSQPVLRNDFKKDLQKSAWNWVFAKMNMQKYATRGLKEDINKFVEQQTKVPFSMRNIYKMIEIVVGTHSQRMDKAIIEVFDKVTSHHHDNRYNVEGWKTNSHYLLGEKFIFPNMVGVGYQGQIDMSWGTTYGEYIEDMLKALCYITGFNYDKCQTLYMRLRSNYAIQIDGENLMDEYTPTSVKAFDSYAKARSKEQELTAAGSKNVTVVFPVTWGEWCDWEYFQLKCYKKGTIHFKFKDRDVWATFNQHVARIKGYPLPEGLKPKK